MLPHQFWGHSSNNYMLELQVCFVWVKVLWLLSCTCTLQGVLPEVTPAASFSQSLKMGGKILYAFVVEEGWGVLAIWALWGSMPKSHCVIWSFSCSKSHLKMQLQVDFNHKEECEGSSDNILADEYLAAVDQGTFQLGFSSSKPRQNNKNGGSVITVIDRSGVHEIGVRWCHCLNAAEHDM